MRIGMLIAGFVLLFNPVITVIDILPDCIGFFLIVAAITKPAYFVHRIDKARSLYFKLALLETVKIFAILVQARVSDEDKTFPLLMATVFGIVELLAFIPATREMFDGLSDCSIGQDLYLSALVKKEKIYKWVELRENGKTKKVKTLAETKEINLAAKVRNYVIFFYVFRVCATIAPELTELEMYDYIGEVHALKRSWASYKPQIQTLVSIIVLILGIVLIVKVSRFFGRIKKDGVLVNIIDERFEREILPRTNLFMAKRMKRVMIFFGLSVITSFVLNFECVNVLIGAISSALLITAAVMLLRYSKKAWIPISIAAVRGILSIVNFINQIKYFDEHEFEAIFWIEDAKGWYYNMATLETVEFAIALAAAVSFIIVFMKVVKEQISLCGVNIETTQYSKKSRDAETYKILRSKLIVTIVVCALNYIMSSAYWYLMPYFTAAGVIGSIVGIIYIVYTIHTLSTVDDLVYDSEISIA